MPLINKTYKKRLFIIKLYMNLAIITQFNMVC